MKLFLKSFHHFGGKLGIQRIHLARLSGRKMDDQKGDNGDKKKRNGFLNNTASDK
jgi:hypothetical protein